MDINFRSNSFHGVNWELCYKPGDMGRLGIIKRHIQTQELCAKWVIMAMDGKEGLESFSSHTIWHAIILRKSISEPLVFIH